MKRFWLLLPVLLLFLIGDSPALAHSSRGMGGDEPGGEFADELGVVALVGWGGGCDVAAVMGRLEGWSGQAQAARRPVAGATCWPAC